MGLLKKTFTYAIMLLLSISCQRKENRETLKPINELGGVPHSFESLWSNIDTRKEPLDVEIIKEWEEDGVVMKVLRYRVGVFRGVKAMMAAIYGYPKNQNKAPALVQIHGGGQYADYRAVLTNGKRGYATISLAWAGRINAPDYFVDKKGVALFWNDSINHPNYKITTDWGVLDGYHAPCRNLENNFNSINPRSWTFDSVPSPRNNSWFLCALGARRAITFLEKQAEVDPNKIGVYGHSMGGKLTVMTATDSRIKAAAPSCGGISNNYSDYELYRRTLADDVYLEQIKCPIIFLNPSNDFHGKIDDLLPAIALTKTKEWRISSSAHSDHQDLPEFEVSGLLWFDQYLKGEFAFPKTPKTKIALNDPKRIPIYSLSPDESSEIQEIDIYFTQQGREGKTTDRSATSRFWHHTKAIKRDKQWIAEIPFYSLEKPLSVFSTVRYALDNSVKGAGYYYREYETNSFVLTSKMTTISSEQLQSADLKPSIKKNNLIEAFDENWQKEWFTYSIEGWGRRTNKLSCDIWKASHSNAKIYIEIFSGKPNKLVIGIDDYAVELEHNGDKWQKYTLTRDDFKDATGNSIESWVSVKELRILEQDNISSLREGEKVSKKLGQKWKGEKPLFRYLKWMD